MHSRHLPRTRFVVVSARQLRAFGSTWRKGCMKASDNSEFYYVDRRYWKKLVTGWKSR